MTLEQYGAAIRAAYEEGYIQGAAHPKRQSVITKARELAALFWAVVESKLPSEGR